LNDIISGILRDSFFLAMSRVYSILYDWALLAYAVGYDGSFGSSAGVVLSNIYPESRSVIKWIRSGWHTILGYVIGFTIMFLLLGWNP